jgi:hypothetical protein
VDNPGVENVTATQLPGIDRGMRRAVNFDQSKQL